MKQKSMVELSVLTVAIPKVLRRAARFSLSIQGKNFAMNGIFHTEQPPIGMKTFVLSLLLPLLQCCHGANNPEAVGTVSWNRDLNAALTAVTKSGKPLFALFQEVPGCAGCRQFGREVLSDPLIKEAIQSEFIPLLIHNNSAGGDSELLKRFGEPAWNYQVVRFFNAKGQDIIPRKDRVWEAGLLVERMIEALTAGKRPVPLYLSLSAAEHSPSLKQAAFAMACFWTGEMNLGKIEGVMTTEAGFIDGKEVVLLSYDPAVISLARLIAAAEKIECAQSVYLPKADIPKPDANRLSIGSLSGYQKGPASDQKKQLSGTPSILPKMTAAQATKMNAWIGEDSAKAISGLSPMQLASFKMAAK